LDADKVQWTLDLIEKLKAANIGDQVRLNSIKNALVYGKTVYESDKKYLQEKFKELNPSDTDTTETNESSINEINDAENRKNLTLIQKLIDAEIGNTDRLKMMKTTLEDNLSLSEEDNSYFQTKIKQLQKVDDVENKIERALRIIDKLQKEEIGNPERLESIKNSINQRRELSEDDDVYLAEKFKQYKKINNQATSRPQNPQYSNSQSRTYNPEFKSEGTTLVLSIVLGLFGISGVGHLYIGQIGKGIGILIGGIILLVIGAVTLAFAVGVIFFIIYLVLFIWQIVDSRKACFYYNGYLEKSGKRPW